MPYDPWMHGGGGIVAGLVVSIAILVYFRAKDGYWF